MVKGTNVLIRGADGKLLGKVEVGADNNLIAKAASGKILGMADEAGILSRARDYNKINSINNIPFNVCR